MSRGGRGGGRGGMLKGATWEHDNSINLDFKPSDLFPRHPNLKRPQPLTDREKRQIKHYKNLQDQIHRGPLYTQSTKRDTDAPARTFGEEQFNKQYGTKRKAAADPFLGVETYSMKYNAPMNAIPKLSGRPFNKELFPKELWPTLDGEDGEKVRKHVNRAIQKKALMLGATKEADPSERTKVVLEKIKNATGGEDGDGEVEEVEEEVEEEQDYDYEDDEADMGGDYDGEQYFENGEDEEEDAGDGGGDDF